MKIKQLENQNPHVPFEQTSHISALRQGHFSVVAFVEFGRRRYYNRKYYFVPKLYLLFQLQILLKKRNSYYIYHPNENSVNRIGFFINFYHMN